MAGEKPGMAGLALFSAAKHIKPWRKPGGKERTLGRGRECCFKCIHVDEERTLGWRPAFVQGTNSGEKPME